MGPFLIGLLLVGVRAGFNAIELAICEGGAGKLDASTELWDSVDLRFLDRVGAILDTV